MAYVKHNFQPGGTIYAADLNAMENQIALNESGKLSKSGDTMTGLLNYKANASKGTAPASSIYRGFYTCDQNGTGTANRYGGMETAINTDGSVTQKMYAYKNEAGSTANTSIGITVYSDGTSATNAPTPATADNSNKIATTAYVKSNLSSYLPLSGGTMTGYLTLNNEYALIHTETNAQYLRLGCTNAVYSNGGSLYLYGINTTQGNAYKGNFRLIATDGSTQKELRGFPSGSLMWAGKEVERVNASGGDYIRYESGIQICWSFSTVFAVASSGETQITYPQAFASVPAVSMVGGFGTDWASGKSYSNTGFLVSLYNATGTKYTSGTKTMSYIAIGRWK